MNLRLSPFELRFRVSADEAQTLLAGSRIDDSVCLGPQEKLSYGLFLHDCWELRSSQGQINLGLPKEQVRALIGGRTKKDLECRKKIVVGSQELTLAFEIDAFSEKKDRFQ
jgi:hypothetical protein